MIDLFVHFRDSHQHVNFKAFYMFYMEYMRWTENDNASVLSLQNTGDVDWLLTWPAIHHLDNVYDLLTIIFFWNVWTKTQRKPTVTIEICPHLSFSETNNNKIYGRRIRNVYSTCLWEFPHSDHVKGWHAADHWVDQPGHLAAVLPDSSPSFHSISISITWVPRQGSKVTPSYMARNQQGKLTMQWSTNGHPTYHCSEYSLANTDPLKQAKKDLCFYNMTRKPGPFTDLFTQASSYGNLSLYWPI